MSARPAAGSTPPARGSLGAPAADASANSAAVPADIVTPGAPAGPVALGPPNGPVALGPPADPVAPDAPGDPEQVARILCLRLLDRRAYTRAELRTALLRRAVPEDAADRVLDRFAELALIDDAALADGYAHDQHQHRGLAGRAVAMRLRRRGIAEETVRAAVSRISPDSEAAAARALAERRLRSMRGLDRSVQARRLVAVLARKGYSPSLAHQMVRAVLSENAEDPGADEFDAALQSLAADGD